MKLKFLTKTEAPYLALNLCRIALQLADKMACWNVAQKESMARRPQTRNTQTYKQSPKLSYCCSVWGCCSESKLTSCKKFKTELQEL